MASNNPLRKTGDVALEDVRGAKTTIAHDPTADEIVVIGANPNSKALRIQEELVAYSQYAYSGTDLIYIGKHETFNASDSDSNWVISKFTYTNGNLTKIQITTGAWEDRETLGW